MSPNRKNALAGVLASTVAVFVIAGIFLSISGGAQNASATFMKRIATFSDISDDNSFNSRVDQTQALFKFSLSEPLGQGLGAIGLSAKLGSAGEVFVIDNGYIARFVEMGFIGVVFFMASVLVAVVLGFGAYRESTQSGNPTISDLLAICFALQVMFLSAQAGADSYFGSQGMFFWFAVYFASAAQKQAATKRNISQSSDSQRLRRLSAAV
jgi:O-antigen ligase